MPRMARLVVPGFPHHVTQRGNRKQKTFFQDEDYSRYLRLLRENLSAANVKIWAYCLMPNHVHLVAVPGHTESLAKLFRTIHHRYAREINKRNGWQGHLWQERFHSYVMDEEHLFAAVRYIELNPVRAGLCKRPDDWCWSSVHAHMNSGSDDIVSRSTILMRIPEWSRFLYEEDANNDERDIHRHTNCGRPAGDASFVTMLEIMTGRRLHLKKRGPARRS